MKKETILLLTLAAVQFTHIVDFMILAPLAPHLKESLHINTHEFSLLVSAYVFSAGIFSFLGAFYVDKYDRKHVLLFNYIGFMIGTFACAVAYNFATLMIARIVAGAFGGVLGSLILAMVGDSIPQPRRARAMSIVMAAFSAASVIGIPLGLYLANKFTWNTPFFFLGGVSIVVGALVLAFIPNMRLHLENQQKLSILAVLKNISKDKNQLFALLLMSVLMLGQFSIAPSISDYMVANVGFTKQQLMYIYLVGGVLTIFTSPIIGRLTDKYKPSTIFTIFIFISLLPIFLITNMPPTPISQVLVVTSIFFICMGGRMIPATAMVTSVVKPQNRGGFMSINSSVQQLAAGIGVYTAGLILIQTPDGHLLNFSYVGYISITCSIIAIFIARKLIVVDKDVATLFN